MGSIATTSAKMKGLKIFFLVFGFSAVQAQTLNGVTEETSEECKVRTGYTKWIAKGETLAKVDFDGKQDKPVQFEAQRGSWFNFRDAATTKVLATWKFEIPKTKDAFICFGEFHVPRKVDTTADTVECDSATEDVLLVKDGATELIKCCGTQCHAKTFKIAQNAADKTFEVTLNIASKTNYPSRWSNPEPTLEKYKLLYKDIVRFQVSASSKKCVLMVYNPDGKKITLTLPADFGGAGVAKFGIDVFVGVISDGTKKGVSIFKNDLTTAAAHTVEWHAPIVTIHFSSGATVFTKLEKASITFAS